MRKTPDRQPGTECQDAYHNLAIAVINRFCQDSIKPKYATSYKAEEIERLKHEARSYISSDGFVSFCDLANLDGETLQQAMFERWRTGTVIKRQVWEHGKRKK